LGKEGEGREGGRASLFPSPSLSLALTASSSATAALDLGLEEKV